MAFIYKKYVKRISKWTVTVVLVALLLGGVLFGLIQTEWGKRQLEQRIMTSLISDPNIRVQTVGLRGIVPFHVRLERMVIADHAGVWLRIEDVDFRWSPLALLRGRIYINRLHVASVHLDRIPFSRKEKQSHPIQWSGWTARLASLVVEDCSLPYLSLAESILGEKASFFIRGGIGTKEGVKALRGFWHVKRTDGPRASAHVNWILEGEDPLLTIDAVFTEAEGGILRTLLDLKDTGAVSLEFKGKGPVTACRGRLIGKVEHLGELASEIELGLKKDLMFKGDGYITLNPALLPPGVDRLLEDGRTHLTLDVRYSRDKELTIHRLHCEGLGFDLRLEGRLDLRKDIVNVEFTSKIADISFLNEITDNKIKGRAVMEGHLSGSLRESQSILSLSLFEPVVGDFFASGVTSDFELEVNSEGPSFFQGLSIRSKGNVIGLEHSDKGMKLPETQVQWSVAAEVKRNSPIMVNELALRSENILLRFSGALDPTVWSLKGNALLDIENLKSFSTLFNTELSGSGRLQAQLEVDGLSRSVSAEIKGQAEEVGPFTPFLAALWGQGVDYQAHVELMNSRYLKISGLQARSSSAELSGDISVNLSSQKTTGKGFLSIPRLSVMNEPMGRTVSGSLALDMQIEGTWLDPRLNIQATGNRIGTEEMLLEQVLLSLQGEDLRKAPRGQLSLEIQQPEYPVKAESEFLLESPRLLLSGLSIAANGTEIGGDLVFDLDMLTAEGSVQGKSDDLTPFTTLLGETIKGSASFQAILSSRENKQDLALDVQGSELGGRFGDAKEFVLGVRLEDVFVAPEGTAELKIQSFHWGELDLRTLTFSAEGEMRKAGFSGNAVGHYRKSFQIQTRGEIVLSESDTGLRIAQFQGQFADLDFELISSAVIRRKAHEYILEEMAFLLDKGRFAVSGRLGVEDMTFDARLEGLPAEALNLITPIEFTGSANGHLQIAGQLDRPKAFMEFSMDDMRFKAAAFQGLPPASLSINITAEEEQLKTDLSLEGLFEKPFRADVKVPAKISLRPLGFFLKDEEEIHGRVSADMDLSLIPAFFYLEDQRLGGRLWADIVFAGGAENPEVKGKVGLSDGTYENLRSGTILRDIQIVAECEQNRIVLADARGTDGDNGTIAAQGWLQLFSSEGFPFQWDLALNNATLIRRDDLTFLTSGDLSFSNTPRETILSGALTIGPAEIRIPDRFPPEVPDLEVVEINRTDRREPEIPEEKKLANGWDLDLRLQAPGRVFVRGRGLDSEWKGELHLMGNAGKPSLTGVLSVIRGRYDFLGKPFSLTSGTLTFGGLSPPSPILDFSADYKRADMTTHIQLSGLLTSLDVSMDSEPLLPADEILSRLLFNRGVSNISPIQALQLGQALNALTGNRSTFDVADRTRRILHVDQLDIRQSEEENGETSVSIGKYLTDNVYVEIEKGVGTEGGRILSEVELTPNLTFESETGTDSHVGVGLNWKWDY